MIWYFHFTIISDSKTTSTDFEIVHIDRSKKQSQTKQSVQCGVVKTTSTSIDKDIAAPPLRQDPGTSHRHKIEVQVYTQYIEISSDKKRSNETVTVAFNCFFTTVRSKDRTDG
jgi:hypothetical protein